MTTHHLGGSWWHSAGTPSPANVVLITAHVWRQESVQRAIRLVAASGTCSTTSTFCHNSRSLVNEIPGQSGLRLDADQDAHQVSLKGDVVEDNHHRSLGGTPIFSSTKRWKTFWSSSSGIMGKLSRRTNNPQESGGPIHSFISIWQRPVLMKRIFHWDLRNSSLSSGISQTLHAMMNFAAAGLARAPHN